MSNFTSTVAAVSTPRGKGGVAMIRVSGGDASGVLERVFSPASGKKMKDYPPNTAVHGTFFNRAGELDDGVCILYRAPRSFTGEDTAELCCHGGMLVTQKLLEAVIEAGASYAGAGEFTRRAFVNGNLTLTEAEAVADIIDARSEEFLVAGLKRLKGALSEKVNDIYDRLKRLVASVYAYIDYPDEDLTDVPPDEMKRALDGVHAELEALRRTSAYGKAISDGVPAAIAGRPNTGKSSLLNLLCGSDRAIVSDILGTTRDVVTERIVLGGVILELSDTAGIRDTTDEIERIGVGKSFSEIDSAACVLLVLDGELTDEDRRIIEYINKAGKADRTVALLNKSDLRRTDPPGVFAREIAFSARTGEGLDELTAAVRDICGAAECVGAAAIITSARQAASLRRAADAVGEASASLDGFTQDIAGTLIEEAMSALAELDGRQASAEIVDEIFSRFCVGK